MIDVSIAVEVLESLNDEQKARALELIRIYKKNLAESSYFEFFKQAWEVLEPSTPLTCNWHIKYLCDVLQNEIERVLRDEDKEHDLIINISPATSKSSIVTKILPAWVWVKDPTRRIISGSYDLDLAKDHTVKTRDILESEWFVKNWGDKFRLKHDKNTQREYANDKMGLRVAVAVGGGAATGKHFDIHIYDDPINPKTAKSKAGVKNVIDWLTQTMANRFKRRSKGLRILVMQRLAEEDPTGYFLDKQRDKWRLIRLPAEDNGKVYPPVLRKYYKDGLFDPVRLSHDDLAAFRLDLGSYGFSGQYDQDPIPSDGNLLKKSWFRRFRMHELEEEARKDNVKLVWNFSVDGAFTANEANDASSIMAFCYFRGNMYVRSVQSVHKELPDLVKFIKEFVVANGYGKSSRIWIEPKASGMPAAQTLKRYTKLNIILDKAPTDDKEVRVKAASPYVEAGRVYLLEDALFVEPFLAQVGGFPYMKADDEVDCLTIAVDHTDNKKGIISHAGTLGKRRKE